MRDSLVRGAIAILLAHQLLLPISSLGQEVRQRRAQPNTEAPQATVPVMVEPWKPPQATVVSIDQLNPALSSGVEPQIRVALATDARAATISTNGHLMNASDVAQTLVALDVARVRLEPRLLSPLPTIDSAPMFRLQVAGLISRVEAEQKSREVRQATGETSQVTYDNESKTWGLLIASVTSESAAEELRAKLDEAGVDATIVPYETSDPPNTTSAVIAKSGHGSTANKVSGTVRSVGRLSMPSREVVAFGPGAGRLFSSSAPVTFASDDATTPVKYNDRPYRGRLEVFANARGALTVVNVLGLEDYVKGVVPNELSAGGFPLIEAHKAQAIAARTYALRNRGQYMSQGFDLLPTTRSQVYRGLASENSLSSRAVDETRGLIATYSGEPINALYTSTCGGRTEDSENIFNQAEGYLRARECSAEGGAALAPFIIRTSREPAEFKDEQNVPVARDVALLAVNSFASLQARINDSWVADEVHVGEVRSWLASVANLARQIAPAVTEDVDYPPAFATALSNAIFGESRGTALLNETDVNYFLAMRDAGDIPPGNRADVAMLVRDGYLPLLPDATLRPRDQLSRARVLRTIARILEAKGLLQLQKGTARPTANDSLVVRNTKGKDLPIRVTNDAFLFRQIGDTLFPVRSVALVGGEPVIFHVNSSGEVDYLEVRPAPNGAAADRFSPFTNWTVELSVGQVQARLGRSLGSIGFVKDLRIVLRGRSQRAVDLEVVGTRGIGHVRGGRIRSALGLREQLFVIERKYDDDGRIIGFTLIGRGWGHGVGMCQVGAYGLARQGFSYEKILKAYYTGIELSRLY